MRIQRTLPALRALILLALVPLQAAGQSIDRGALADAEKMARSRATAAEVAATLQRTHKQSGDQSLAILHRVGYAAGPASQAARSVYRASFASLAGWMHRAGYDDGTTLGALTRQRATPSEVTEGLRGAGASSAEIAAAYRKVRMDPARAVEALSAGGYGAAESIDGLARAGYAARELTPTVQKIYADRSVWLGPITRALTAEGVLDPADPGQMADEARALGLPATEAVTWMEGQGVDELDALAALARAGYAAAEVGEAAASRVDTEAEATTLATQMRVAGVAARTAVVVLSVALVTVTLGAGAMTVMAAVSAVMVAAGFGVGAVIGAVSAEGGTPGEIVEGLWAGGVSGAQIAQAAQMQGAWNLTTSIEALWQASGSLGAATQAVHAAGYGAESIVGALTQVGASAGEQTAALRELVSVAGLPLSDAATLLVAADVDPETIGAVLGGAFPGQPETIALRLKAAGMGFAEIGLALRRGLGLPLDQVVELLHDQGVTYEALGEFLDSSFGTAPLEIAELLFAQGMRPDALLNLLITGLNVQHERALEIMAELGG